jgi:TrmH family RNA methyltransferase
MKALRALKTRKGREKANRFLAEGVRVVEEALNRGAPVDLLLLSETAREDARALAARAERSRVETVEIEDEAFREVASTLTPQGVAAVIRRESPSPEGMIRSGGDLLFLDEVQDPGNMGTLLRVGWAFGLAGVLVGKGSVDPFQGKVVRAAAGAHFGLPVSDPQEAGPCLDRARQAGRSLVVTAAREGTPFEEARYGERIVLVLGNEGAGVSQTVREMADLTVRIPLVDGAESVNVAVASGILLYHICRRKRAT